MQKIYLQELREKKKFSQEELSKISNVSRTTISLIETGKATTVKLSTLKRLAKALDIKTENFFTNVV